MNDFEKYTKDTLKDYPSPVDTERLWGNIDRELRPGKRRPAPFWLWGLGLGLAAAIVLIVYIQIDRAEVVPAAQQPGQNVIAGHTGEEPGSFNSPRRHGGTEQKSDRGFTPCWQTPPPAPIAFNLRARIPLSAPFTPTPDPSPTGRGDVEGSVEYTSTHSTEDVAVYSRSPLPVGEGSGVGVNGAESNTQPLVLKAMEAGGGVDTPTPTQATDNQIFVSSPDRMVLSGRSVFPLLPTLLRNLSPTPPPTLPPGPKTDCSDWGKGPAFRPYFGLYGGAMYPLKSLSAKKTDFENIAAGRQETETVLEGVAVGGYLGMKHRNGLFGEAGLEYQRINERFDLSSMVTDTIGKVAVIGIIIHAPGDTTFISDSVAVLRETRFVKRTYNNYRFLQVPLAIGYEWRTGSSWRFYGKAGVNVNISLRQKAEILNLTGQPEKYTSEKGGAGYPFRSKIGLSPFATVGARYRLTPNLSLFAELRYLHQGGELTAEAYPLRQQYRLPGGNVGAHFQF